MTSHLEIEDVAKSYGGTRVLDDVGLSMPRGEFVALLGPSGCGKTTLLRVIAGLVSPDRGRLRLDGRDITGMPAHRRNLGVVFQNYALFPHLSVAENVAFGLKVRRLGSDERRARVRECLGLVRMEAFEDRSVKELSGGQQQRVALARALAIRPDMILLDEPLAALDRKLREQVQVELRQLLRRLGITSVFVTHDQDEALVLADRIGVMDAGRIEQLSAPVDLYGSPASRFVLDFVGRSCLISGRVVAEGADGVRIETPYGPVRALRRFLPGVQVDIGLRPECLSVGPPPDAGVNALPLRVADRIFLGSRVLVTFEAEPGHRLLAELDPPAERLVPGAIVTAWWPVSSTHVFPASGRGRAAPPVPSPETPPMRPVAVGA